MEGIQDCCSATYLVVFHKSLNRVEMLSFEELTEGLIVISAHDDGVILESGR